MIDGSLSWRLVFRTCCAFTWKIFLFALIFGLITSTAAAMIYLSFSGYFFKGRSFELPFVKYELIGREQEMEELTGYFRDEAVEVVTLYSGPGYGKTIMSQHIGRREIEAGTDVYYISVNVLPNVERLVEKLINISGLKLNPDDDKLKSWTKTISWRTLLILDDVYGTSWLRNSTLASFRKDFIGVLLQHSRDFYKNLKILITSQQEIKPRQCEFRSVNLKPPSLPACVTMFRKFANMSSSIMYYVSDSCEPSDSGCLERGKVESVCTRVGRVPKVLETLASHLSVTITIDRLIDRIDTENALEYADDSAEPGDATHLIAYKVVFDSIQPKYQICCVLLAKFPGFFTVPSTESVITRDVMTDYSKTFHVSECINDLDRKKFVESTIYSSFMGMTVDYHIHNLTRDFLMTTDEDLVPKKVLKPFWYAYIEHAEDAIPDPWLREDLFEVDTEIILDFLSRREHNSYRLARHVTNHISAKMGGAVALVRDEAVNNVLLPDCKDLSLTYPPASAPVILQSYRNIFSMLFAGSDKDNMDKLAICEAKVDQLNSQVGYSLSAVSSYFDIEDSLYFQSTASLRCKNIQNAHEMCGSSWRCNLLDFIAILLLEIDNVEDQCNFHVTYPDCIQYIVPCHTNNGLILYSTNKYEEAEEKLQLALKDDSSSHCREIHDVIVYIVLYDIYFNRSDQQKADEVLANIAQIDFEEANLTCYQTLLKDIVIPFLAWINSTGLAEQTDTLKRFHYSPFIEENMRMLSEERADQIFAGEESLFCLASTDLLEGCLP